MSLQWDTPDGEVVSYTVTCCSEGKTVQELATDTNSLTFSCLKPGVCYSFHVSAQLKNGTQTKQTVTSVKTSKWKFDYDMTWFKIWLWKKFNYISKKTVFSNHTITSINLWNIIWTDRPKLLSYANDHYIHYKITYGSINITFDWKYFWGIYWNIFLFQ